MKKRKHALPEDTSDIERAVKCAERHYTVVNAEGEIVCCLPKLLNPPQGSAAEILLWAALGRKLAPKESEFSRGQGKTPGSKNKNRRDDILPGSKNTRTWRDNKAAEKERERLTAIIRGPEGEDYAVRLDEGPPEPPATAPSRPTEPVDLYDARFEFKNYGDVGYSSDLAIEQERDKTWYTERGWQKHERWLAKKRDRQLKN
jgi:hypothetical protein